MLSWRSMPDTNVSTPKRIMIEQAQLGYEFRQATLAWRGEITDAQRELSRKLEMMIRQAREQKLPGSVSPLGTHSARQSLLPAPFQS